MSERKIIEEKLRKKEQEIQSLEEKIRTAKVYVQALQDVLRSLGGNDPTSSREGESVMKPGSAVAKVREFILNKGTPLHINQLVEMLGKDVTRESRASLTSSVAAYVRRGEVFTRPAPNTFGLAELGHRMMPTSQPLQEPPKGFGTIVETSKTEDDDVPF
jgi:hypothetical protein